MKLAYKFSNLLGTVYHKGDLVFSGDGNTVISPVGNRVTLFDLKNNKSETLPLESEFNITCLALSPDGALLIAVNEEGEALLCSLMSKTVIHHYHFHRPIRAIKFSPDGKKFAVTKENMVQVFHAPGKSPDFNPFNLYRTFYGAYDQTVCIDWTTDSQAFCVGAKDMNTRVYGTHRFQNLIIYSLGGHSDCIVGSFFDNESLDLYTVSQNGHVNFWECDTQLDELKIYVEPEEPSSDEEDEEDDVTDKKKVKTDEVRQGDENKTGKEQIKYKRIAKHNFKAARGEGAGFAKLMSVDYHKRTHILVTGFQDGAFFLHEMPDFNMIHSLSISEQTISSVQFNSSGDWLALGCQGVGQLLVWEWQSESYVMKQQGHFNNMTCLAYSPDGQYIVTGGDDGKVKVWNTTNGFCFVTFNEHMAGITGVTFTQNGQVVLSCSLDGTVRAFDLNRYRNFRTFTSPRPAQFSCLAVDSSGDVVCAGSLDSFEIYVWSMQTGRLLDVLSGHEGPISSLSFSLSTAILASASWDKTVKLWDVFEHKGSKETLTLNSDVLAVAMRPDGKEVAIATLNAQISFWDVTNAVETHNIEGRHDIGYTRKELDKITAKKSAFGKAFSALCYTADGTCILAGGRSKYVCIYSIQDQLLLKKFEISQNKSFDGTEEFLDRRKMTEWGSMAMVETGEGDKDGTVISLPGVKKGDMSSRNFKPEVRVSALQFSPTGRSWSATTTEGLLTYSLDGSLMFDPFQLAMDVTPENTRRHLESKEYVTAIMMSFKLNEENLIKEVVENVPVENIEYICGNLAEVYEDKLLSYISTEIEKSRHIEFYLHWVKHLLYQQGPRLKQRSLSLMATLTNLQKNLTRKYEDLSKMADFNKYTMQFITSMAETYKLRPAADAQEDASANMSDQEETVADLSDSDEDILSTIRHENVVAESDSSESMET